jgi:epoxyqueuosine reductase
LNAPKLAELIKLDDAAFRALFAGSPVKRIGHARFLRNLLIAIGNSGDASLLPQIEQHMTHDSPLVRGMAAWAAAQLLPRDAFIKLAATQLTQETDVDVRGEWERAQA